MEFHRYPQVIAGHCNERAFGPPWGFTPTSTCSWIGHPVSGLLQQTRRAINPRFPFASGTEYLKLACYNNSPDHSTKGTRSHLNVLSLLVSTRFQVLFHSPPGVLFTFPSRYYALSVAAEYLALGGGPPCFRQDSSCPGVLRHGAKHAHKPPRTGLSPPPAGLPRPFRSAHGTCRFPRHRPTTPACVAAPGFGLFPFRSPLLRESLLISFPAGT